MVMISLRDYNHEIESLIEANQNDEAIFHCMIILRSFPKAIDTYRNLGKALLESKRFTEASDVFSKILSVFPDDFISHVGLSVIKEEDRDLDVAIWHMEQAFEIQPSNLALQEELRRLFGRRDGVPPSKIRLTRGALVKMYARGELHQQAIAEIKSVLKDEPSRVDYKVLLAKMYQISGSETEAVEVATDIVKEYPYCYEANRILDELLSPTNTEEANIYRNRVISLNPYYQYVSTQSPDPNEVLAEKIILEKLDYSPSYSQKDEIPDWSKQIGINWDKKDAFDSNEPINIMDQVDAFNENASEPEEKTTVSPFIGDFSPEINREVENNGNNEPEPLPDWITKAGWTRSTHPDSPAEQSNLIEPIDNQSPPDVPSDNLPDWLRSFGEETESEIKAEAEQDLVSSAPDIESPSDVNPPLSSDELKEAITSWIDDKEFEEPKEAAKEQEPLQNSDWLTQFEQVEKSDEGHELESELPEWLKSFDQEGVVTPEKEESSDWLSTFEGNPEKELTQPEDLIESLDQPTEVFQLDKMINDVVENGTEEQPLSIEENSPAIPEELEIQPEIADNKLEDEIPSMSVKESDATKSEIPSWVKSIIYAPEPMTNEEIISPQVSEEEIEPLISDLPSPSEHVGVISSETNEDLLSWLREETPEENENTEAAPAELENMSPAVEPSEPEITLENLSEDIAPTSNELEEEPETGLPGEEISTPEFEDRLSDLLSQPVDENVSVAEVEEPIQSESVENEINQLQPEEVTSVVANAVEEVVRIEEPPTEVTFEEKMATLVEFGEYDSLNELIGTSVSDGMSIDAVIETLKVNIQNHPDSYQLWQELGDLYFCQSDFEMALSAYQKAEQIINH